MWFTGSNPPSQSRSEKQQKQSEEQQMKGNKAKKKTLITIIFVSVGTLFNIISIWLLGKSIGT
jgi:nitrate reductase NapE component